MVKIPADYLDLKTAITVTPDEVEEAFVKANPGLTREASAVNCDRQRLREVRLCVSKDFRFRDCAERRSPRLPAGEADDAAGARRLITGGRRPARRQVALPARRVKTSR